MSIAMSSNGSAVPHERVSDLTHLHEIGLGGPHILEEPMNRLNAYALVLAVSLVGAAAAEAQESSPRAAASKAVSSSPVNINTASAADLQRLPGIGAATAGRIIEYREKNGPFSKPEELMNVRGIGEKSFLKLKPLVVVTPPKADAAKR